MLIEFQTTAANFLYQFRETLKGAPMALTDEQTDSTGRVRIINRVVIGNANQVRSDQTANFEIRVGPPGALVLVPGRQVQVIQPVTIEIVFLDDLVKSGDLPAPVIPVPIWVIFNLSLTVIGGTANLSTSYSEVTGLLPPDDLADIDSRLRGAIPTQISPVDLSSVQDIISGLDVVNAGISRHPGAFQDTESIAMRIEVGSPDSGATEWGRFLNGSYDNLLVTPGMRAGLAPPAAVERWAVFLDKGILERYVTTLLADSFGPGKKMQLRSGIDAHWSNPGGQARLDASFKAIAIDACDLGPLGTYDIRLDIQIPILLSVPADNVLRQNLKINYWKNDLDTAACVIGVSLFWPIVGWDLMSKNKVKWWQFEALLLLPPARFVAALVKANDTSIDPPDATMKKLSDDEFESDQSFSKKPPGPTQPLILLDYRGLGAGLVLMGRQLPFPDTCPPLIESDHCGFEFKPPHIPCSSVAGATPEDLEHGFSRQVYAAASAIVNNVGEKGCPGLPQKVLLQGWNRRFLDDNNANKLQIQLVEDDYTDGIAIKLRCPLPPDDYYLDPKPVQLLLKTNGGARVFTYPPLLKPSDSEIDKLAIIGAAKAINDCKLQAQPWWVRLPVCDPLWIGDPAVFRSPGERQLWTMSFLGMGQGDSVTVRLGDRRVQTVRSNARGQSLVTVMQPAQSAEQLTLEYHPGSKPVRATDGRMFMSQVTLTELASCHFAAPVERLEVTRSRRGRTLYAIHAEGFSEVDLSVPAAPFIAIERRGERFRGSVFDGDGMLAFAGEKPVRAETLAARPAAGSCGNTAPVVCTLTTGGRFYVVRERQLDVFDRALCHVRMFVLDHSTTHAVVAGERLVVGGPSGVGILDPGASNAHVRHFDIGPVDSLQAGEAAGAPGDHILVRTRERTALFELPDAVGRSQDLAIVAEYDEPPWFGGAIQFDSYMATFSDRLVTISSIIGRVTPCHPPA